MNTTPASWECTAVDPALARDTRTLPLDPIEARVLAIALHIAVGILSGIVPPEDRAYLAANIGVATTLWHQANAIQSYYERTDA